jgi:hypothetical protein
MKHGVTVRYGTWAALLAAMLVIGFCPAANALQRPAVKARSTWEVDMRRAARSIALIVARQDACKTADPGASVGTITECDWVATQAYEKLIPRSRSTGRFYALLTDLEGAFLFTLTPKEDHDHATLGASLFVSAQYADLARRRAGILTGARAAPSRQVDHGGRGLFDWIDRTRGLAAWHRVRHFTTRTVTRRWVAIRNADCAVYPVPRCAERLDDAMRQTVRELTTPG